MNSIHRTFLLVFLSLATQAVTFAAEPEWGHLSGRFVYDGEVPATESLPVPAQALRKIGGKEFPDESLIVGENGGLANVFIWLRPAIGEKPPVHPSYDDPPVSAVDLVAREYRLQPRAFVVRTKQTLNFHHADANIGYHLTSDLFHNPPLGMLIPAGKTQPITIQKAERLPVAFTCSIHPWMRSNMLLLDHPYATVTDRDGRFEIRNLPAGSWDFVAWHERPGYIKQPTIDGRKLEWKRGTFQREIAAGDNPLGDILVAGEAFQRK